MKYHTQQSGYSLVEVLVSISILLIATVGPMAIAAQSLKSSKFALEQNTAYFLAQEGIEAMFAIRNNYALLDIDNGLTTGPNDMSWDWVIAGNSDPDAILNDNDLGDPCRGPNRLSGNSPPNNTCELGIEINGSAGSYNQVQLIDCNGNNASSCDVLLDETNDRAVYNHTSGSPTQFRRIIRVTRETDFSIKVESIVTWDSNVFSTEQSVNETVYLFDSNFES